ncbi:MAG: hypothetical protein IH616_16550 [Gemmatimonadales bacterium]|nr:hypothetical protein [Gemmatimonadales bacterium]
MRRAVAIGLGAACTACWGPPPDRRDRTQEPCGPAGETIPLLEAGVVNASDALALPTGLALVGDYLVVLDAASDSVLHVVDRRDGSLFRSLGRRGRGPGEFDGPWSLDVAEGAAPAVWVWDVPLRRLTHVPLTPDSDAPLRETRQLRLADGVVLTEPRWLGADTIVSPGLAADTRLVLYGPAGQRIGGLGRGVPLEAGQPFQATQAELALRPDRRRLAVANRYVSRIDLVGTSGALAVTVEGPVSVNEGRPIVELDRFAFVDVAATAEHVVALFSGRTRADFGGRAVFGACLQVFDWQGALKGAYRLDSDVIAIAVAQDESAIYGVRHLPVPAVVRFALPRSQVYAAAGD